MTEKLLELISLAYPLTARDPGAYGAVNINGMDFTLCCFDAKGLGNVSVMHGEMPGMMRMDTLVLNPFQRDMPLLSYDRIFAGGKDTCFLEMYDTCLTHAPDMQKLQALQAKHADLQEVPTAPHWYDGILYPESMLKTGDAALTSRLNQLTEDYLAAYLQLCGEAPACDPAAKKKAASAYTEGLLNQGGASTDNFLKAKGKEFTQGMFREVLFGTGTPE